MKLRSLFAWLLALVGCTPTAYTHGIPNLAQVDGASNVWRGGQPTTADGWAYLKSLGIKRVVKLNFEPTEGSDDGARAIGLEVHVHSIQPEGDVDVWDEVLGTFVRPSRDIIALALEELALGDAFVHCTHGQDRTGLVVGEFRVQRQGWSRDDAWSEMIAHGFHPELVGLTSYWLDPGP